MYSRQRGQQLHFTAAASPPPPHHSHRSFSLATPPPTRPRPLPLPSPGDTAVVRIARGGHACCCLQAMRPPFWIPIKTSKNNKTTDITGKDREMCWDLLRMVIKNQHNRKHIEKCRKAFMLCCKRSAPEVFLRRVRTLHKVLRAKAR
jgi:hypothetical protein